MDRCILGGNILVTRIRTMILLTLSCREGQVEVGDNPHYDREELHTSLLSLQLVVVLFKLSTTGQSLSAEGRLKKS